MISVKTIVKSPIEYIKVLLKWIILATIVGLIGGTIGSVFHICIDIATEQRMHNWWMILLLPVGGVVIAVLYRIFRGKGKISTDRVIESVRSDESIPLIMVPLIFISTCITHLVGGSAGREGAALQIGGSLGYNIGKTFRLKQNDLHTVVMTGMSAVFAALFGTPLTAAFFALEVSSVGVIYYVGLVPCIISAITAYTIAGKFGISPVKFEIANPDILSAPVMGKVIILAILCAVVAMLFCTAIKKCSKYSKKLLPNSIARGVIGGIIVAGLSFAIGTFDYNGAGMDVITDALNGHARYEAFLLKIIFTAISISAGFKGGEIVPAFFIGSTFGCIAGGLLGLNPAFGAAVGFVALFCGVVNCPIASTILALEVFGADSLLLMATVCGVSYMMSGYFSLYKSQRIVYSKLNEDLLDK